MRLNPDVGGPEMKAKYEHFLDRDQIVGSRLSQSLTREARPGQDNRALDSKLGQAVLPPLPLPTADTAYSQDRTPIHADRVESL